MVRLCLSIKTQAKLKLVIVNFFSVMDQTNYEKKCISMVIFYWFWGGVFYIMTFYFYQILGNAPLIVYLDQIRFHTEKMRLFFSFKYFIRIYLKNRCLKFCVNWLLIFFSFSKNLETPRGTGLWKFSNSLCSNIDYTTKSKNYLKLIQKKS